MLVNLYMRQSSKDDVHFKYIKTIGIKPGLGFVRFAERPKLKSYAIGDEACFAEMKVLDKAIMFHNDISDNPVIIFTEEEAKEFNV